MTSEAVSVSANLQFREVRKYHGGSFRIKYLDHSDPDSAQRKENLGDCQYFQDYINHFTHLTLTVGWLFLSAAVTQQRRDNSH